MKLNNNSKNLPKPVHFWEIEGFVRLSEKVRNEFKALIKSYGVRKLANDLGFDRETIYSIYSYRLERAHSIFHLVKVVEILNYDLRRLEKNIIAFGRKQGNMYNFSFPFILSPLYLRAVTIHGDGSFDKMNGQAEYYQHHNHMHYFESLLRTIFAEVSSRRKCASVSSITVPSILTNLVCRSLDMDLRDFFTKKFFCRVSELPVDYKFQVFLQFIVDEAHFKGTTLTVSQKKQWSREGFKVLLKSLNFEHSNPTNNKDDITIYNLNFQFILAHLNKSKDDLGEIAGLWFKEKKFLEACERVNPEHYPLIRESTRINKQIFEELSKIHNWFTYQDIRNFRRTHSQVQKAIRCWKKNKLIKREGWNKYKIL